VLPKEWWEDVGLARDIASANDRLLSDLMMRVARLEQGAEETSRQIATAEAMATVSTTHDTPSPSSPFFSTVFDIALHAQHSYDGLSSGRHPSMYPLRLVPLCY